MVGGRIGLTGSYGVPKRDLLPLGVKVENQARESERCFLLSCTDFDGFSEHGFGKTSRSDSKL